MSKNATAAAAIPSNEMLEMDQMAETELDRLQKQVSLIRIYRIYLRCKSEMQMKWINKSKRKWKCIK